MTPDDCKPWPRSTLSASLAYNRKREKRRRILKRIGAWSILAVLPVCFIVATAIWVPVLFEALLLFAATIGILVGCVFLSFVLVTAGTWAWENK